MMMLGSLVFSFMMCSDQFFSTFSMSFVRIPRDGPWYLFLLG
jgi:hypothetical protein